MGKRTVVYAHNGILVSNKNNELFIQTNTWTYVKILLIKRSQKNEYILYNSIKINF